MADTTTPLQEGGAAAIDPYAGHTPIMRQYLMLKDKHPGVLLLYRLGDFYETFSMTLSGQTAFWVSRSRVAERIPRETLFRWRVSLRPHSSSIWHVS